MAIQTIATDFEGARIFVPDVFEDDRGFFKETYSTSKYRAAGLADDFVQDSVSFSALGVVRGLHRDSRMAKLVQVLRGRVWDVIVDLRPQSPTFARHQGFFLSEHNHRQLYVPAGFANGFLTLTPDVVFSYNTLRTLRPGDRDGNSLERPGSRGRLAARGRAACFRERSRRSVVRRVRHEGSLMRVLVTGGAGYIGAVLCRELLAVGHAVVVLDRFFWGREALAGLDVTCVSGDLRALEPAWFDGVEAVCHLGGLSNDPTAEYNTAANWEMNAVATARLVETCKARGIRRFTFASSASIYDTDANEREIERSPIMCDETTEVRPRGAYSLSKRRAEETILGACDDTFLPVVFRQGTVYGYSPRMRFDLVVNTFIKDAVLKRRLFLHGGGWMWRPLVDVVDVARAHVAALAAPETSVAGQIYNVMEENYQIRQLAMLVAGSLSLVEPKIPVELVETPAPALVRNYRMSNAKLTRTLDFTPSRTVLESIRDMLQRLPLHDPAELADSRFYNIAWMSLLERVHAEQRAYDTIY